MSTKICQFCLLGIKPCPEGESCPGSPKRTAAAAYCYGWVHHDGPHRGHPDGIKHSARPEER